MARLQDAIAEVNSVVGLYGVTIHRVDAAYAASANVVVHAGTVSVGGGYSDGVLGCMTDPGEITLIQGWNWYTGVDTSQIAADQYDFQTVVTHEVGRALGLGHSGVSTSVMYATLSSGATKSRFVIPGERGMVETNLAAQAASVNSQGREPLDGGRATFEQPRRGDRRRAKLLPGARAPGY